MKIVAKFDGPHLLVRGQDNRIFLKCYQDGSQVSPDSGNVSVFDQDNNAIVDDQSVTIATDGTIQYNIGSATLPSTLSYSAGWRVEWDITFGSALTESGAAEELHFINDASLVKTKVHPVVTEQDLEDLHSEIDELLPSDQSSWQDQVDSAFNYIRRRLLKDGRRPELIISSWSLADAHICLSLSYIFRDMATFTSGTGKYIELANHYKECFEKEWDSLVFEYDEDEDGEADEDPQISKKVVSLHAGPTNRRWWDRDFS